MIRTGIFPESLHHGEYLNAFSGEVARFEAASALDLPAWDDKVYVRHGKASQP